MAIKGLKKKGIKQASPWISKGNSSNDEDLTAHFSPQKKKNKPKQVYQNWMNKGIESFKYEKFNKEQVQNELQTIGNDKQENLSKVKHHLSTLQNDTEHQISTTVQQNYDKFINVSQVSNQEALLADSVQLQTLFEDLIKTVKQCEHDPTDWESMLQSQKNQTKKKRKKKNKKK